MDIAEFLLERFGEDEAVAREAAGTGGWPENPARPMQDTWHTDAEPYPDGKWWPTQIRSGSWVIAGGRGNEDDGVDGHVARHIARWDPARVLAECEAKREIVEEFTMIKLIQEWHDIGPAEGAWAKMQQVLRLLAMPYSDHPDYDPAWALEVSASH